MLKHNITGTEIFDIDKKFINIIESTKKYNSISKEIGYPLNFKPYKPLVHNVGYDYSRKDDFYLPGVPLSRFISNIKTNRVYRNKTEEINPCFYDIFPKKFSYTQPKDETYIDDIINPPKLNKPVTIENTKAIELGVIGYTEGDMVIKKMTQDNIDESKDINYYENFLQDHLKKKYDRLYPKNITPSSTPVSTPPSTPISTPISTSNKKISSDPINSSTLVEVKPVFQKKEEVKKEEVKKEEVKKEEVKDNSMDEFFKEFPQIYSVFTNVLISYKEDNKLNKTGINILNEILINSGKPKLGSNVSLLTTISTCFINRFLGIYTPIKENILSKKKLDDLLSKYI